MQYYGNRLSENIVKREPEGYLYCLNVPIAKAGQQEYLRSEIGLDLENGKDTLVTVYRKPEEVFNRAAIASFEGMPVTREHPPEEVDTKNINAYHRGHVQNVRRGSGEESDLLLGDLVVTDEGLIDGILHGGEREVSCGYTLNYVQGADGRYYQTDIRGNHVAVLGVSRGRAGERVAIQDAEAKQQEIKAGIENTEKRGKESVSNRKGSIWGKMFASFAKDENVPQEEIIEAADEFLKGEAAKPETKEGVKDTEMSEEKKQEEVKKPETAVDEGLGALLQIVQQLAEEVKELKAAIANRPSVDEDIKKETGLEALDELEKEVTEPVKPVEEDESLVEQVEEVTVPADEIETDGEVVTPENTAGTTNEEAKEAVIEAIKDIKPIIAKLPEEERKAASDAAAKAIRRAAGLDSSNKTAARQRLAKLSAPRKVTAKDSSKPDDGRKLGRDIMQKFNPHYRNK